MEMLSSFYGNVAREVGGVRKNTVVIDDVEKYMASVAVRRNQIPLLGDDVTKDEENDVSDEEDSSIIKTTTRGEGSTPVADEKAVESAVAKKKKTEKGNEKKAVVVEEKLVESNCEVHDKKVPKHVREIQERLAVTTVPTAVDMYNAKSDKKRRNQQGKSSSTSSKLKVKKSPYKTTSKKKPTSKGKSK
ncbi:uncharacterized protein LOC118479606 [Helianthus annuus]|uniref:uncharacterized protein LOC118479606 n=1 Tax=Helianthus annuus TaxID=4232 RepID=UPI0016532FBC|nr:uncharacterized protein LOC118479606 [Helianthus annuus]